MMEGRQSDCASYLSRQTGEKREQRKSCVSEWHLMFSRGIQEVLCWLTWNTRIRLDDIISRLY